MTKILELKDLIQKLDMQRRSGKRVVFTNGCFDILHVGHVRYLAAARAEGDVLVVGLNSDESVRTIKDESRPIVNQDQRAEILAGLWCVDYITIFNEPDPLKLITAIKPDVLVKGADWKEQDIVGAEVVKAGGGKVARVAVVPGISTSMIIERIAKRYRFKEPLA
ncbi:MAG: D-glycero-beta-D-manno-heptose 1-phosphate adenylyltransferase [Pseudomonadota bacterium]|uniref:D-glycero-beta-D-manno-heptose 1-phosphate adenylyltransferase n=1 Tax=Candidatus Desulfatibia profunda TaxID=2841695 RepID=A0A8J6NN33_9BACT|nr:D-glycero-beta-D-manno-heptose 1-phosphate adenylyltransferase [Candidatus Desulfatibia profunda]MBL7181167.1 D-glycero-beta-D-manno-heptose 1-phosphate adenylyltransferase [Desulfobacterales bacterium]